MNLHHLHQFTRPHRPRPGGRVEGHGLPHLLLGGAGRPGGIGATEQYSFTANVDRDKLSSAPNFDKNQWPDFSRGGWNQRIYSHFGVSPEGGAGGTGSGLDKSGAEKGAGAGGLQPKSDIQR